MNSLNITLRTYINFDIENNDKDLRFKVSDHVRISEYKHI